MPTVTALMDYYSCSHLAAMSNVSTPTAVAELTTTAAAAPNTGDSTAHKRRCRAVQSLPTTLPKLLEPAPPAPPTAVQAGSMTGAALPWVEIVEQPWRRVRFRYRCEGRGAGSIPGTTSRPDRKTAPTIKIHNYSGLAAVVVSCVRDAEPHLPHPHRLVGRNCKDGVCTVKQNTLSGGAISFPTIGIQCAKKKAIKESLKEREKIQVDPFNTGYTWKYKTNLKAVRLCYQVFLDGPTLGYTAQFIPVPPVVSDPIYDRTSHGNLVICKLSKSSCTALGGKEIIILCEKFQKDDVEIRLFETNKNGEEVWEAFGKFNPATNVHKSLAIWFQVPPYRNATITECRYVNLELRKRSNSQETSAPHIFIYKPVGKQHCGDDKDAQWKRPRLDSSYVKTVNSSSIYEYADSTKEHALSSGRNESDSGHAVPVPATRDGVTRADDVSVNVQIENLQLLATKCRVQPRFPT